jgi:hypothetical protein
MKTKTKQLNIITAAIIILGAGYASAGTVYLEDSFRGTTAANWTFVAGQGDGPSLTAADGIDTDGDGWLRLTKDVGSQSSFVYYNNSIPTNEGLVFTFDFVIWGSGSALGDGLTLAIFDANVTPAAGAYGGSLGYSKRSGIQGLAGGIVGIGFDVFGNYSNPTEGRVGGPGKVANSIAVRGSMGDTRNDGYEYVTGTNTLTGFSTPGAASRPTDDIHTVRITITTDKLLTVEWKLINQDWQTLIDAYQCDLECPAEVKFGYTAGTGSSKANHEIRNLSVTAVPEPATAVIFVLGGFILKTTRKRSVN